MAGAVRRTQPPLGTFSLACGALSVACGGGAPLMHPAHTLNTGEVTFGAGVSGNFAAAGIDDAIDEARTSDPAQAAPASRAEQEKYARGTVAHLLAAPGVAPWVGARAGIGYDADAGVTYFGRAIRVDGRYALQGDDLALSGGVGFTGVMTRPGSDPPIDENAATDPPRAGDGGIGGLDAGNVTGWGVDVPVLGGWRSAGSLVQIWAGPRAGYERITGDVRVQIEPDPRSVQSGPVDAARWHVGGLIGLSIGVKPIWVAVELGAAYQAMEGHLELADATGAPTELDSDASGVTLTPSGAVVGRF